MKYTADQLHRAKAVDMTEFLAMRGFNPDHTKGGELVYSSPLKDEKTPSFYVNPQKNVFNDFSTGNFGDTITLCRLLDNTDFSGAMETLLGFRGGTKILTFERSTKVQRTENKAAIKKNLPLHSQNMVNYFLNQRMIEEKIAYKYLTESIYENQHGTFSAGSWQNDAGGYELRSPKIKGCIGTKAPTTFLSEEQDGVLTLFEGYLDFLSWLTHKGERQLVYTDVIVLNSLSTLSKSLMSSFWVYDRVNVYFDNDPAGQTAYQKVREFSPTNIVLNQSSIQFPDYKDYNDFLCQKLNPNYNV